MTGATRGRPSRRADYLDAIIAQLMTTGINDLSLRELAGQIGTSHRVLIYHFTSKERLVNEAVHEVRKRERELFHASHASAGEGLSAKLIAFFEHNFSQGMRSYFTLFYEVWGIALSRPDAYEPFLDGIVSVWVESLADILRSVGFPEEKAIARATVILATLRGLQLDLFTTGQEPRVRAAFMTLVTLIQSEADALALVSPNPRGNPDKKNHVNGEAL